MGTVHLLQPWLVFDLGREMQVLSWAINRPGFAMANRIVWREVRNADLPVDLDVRDWFSQQLSTQNYTDAIAFITSRDVSCFTRHTAQVGEISAQCIATVGLSNAERIGHRVDRSTQDWGTINIAVRLNVPLSQTGLIEALSIATQARTAAVIDAAVMLETGVATGTGTDCIAIAAPAGPQDYAGLHTDLGEAVGAAVYAAVKEGADSWKSSVGRLIEAQRATANP
ncbi:adenosylcobinamide amidohydrolase [Sulfitobacter sp. F26169L]|uniref:adenosylcobinamide amidohydrolase n=1 Tax=Sulfitobacter sp. F26169L TaxID=2996015 RepID=UPI0022609757|nr:adenosylcobinamide amidohydrolase [Sulfitobacter sp. F26169L]MCX7567416.1 adenosylcobinamide amidohydrolase [Sulfitobacter sp. F26169L]